jgi:cellulose synthase/poly-beta-1,6-N-acetylglucosamine synthase-like glycosyltransferase
VLTVKIAFWLAALSLVYVYAGFPLLVMIVGRIRNRVVRKAPITPTMSLIIPAYNEEEVIAERLENVLTSDYPRDSLEIIVVSDGSSDATEAIVAEFEGRGVRLLARSRQGKNAALEYAVGESTGSILVFSDANIFCEPYALRALAANFADPSVGGVAGNASYRLKAGSESSSQGESLYWRYDTWLKELENRTGSVVSAHGALYALRRELYMPPPDVGAVDDFAISTAVVEAGHRLVFEPMARAYEFAITEARREYRRRVRNMTMSLRAVALRRRLLNPFRYGFYSLILFSHKVLRRVLSLSLLVLLVTSLVLSGSHPFFALAAGGQVAFYGLAVAGYFARRRWIGRRGLLYVPFYYCMANTAAFMALVQFARGERIALWQPQRHPEVA